MRDAKVLRLPDGSVRYVVPYDDYDGISLIADRDALLARYRHHDVRGEPPAASVTDDPTATLTALANANELVAWGTHQPIGSVVAVVSLTPFAAGELEQNRILTSIDAGCLQLNGELYVAAWHSFTYGCDHQRGEIDCPRLTLPPGRYRVTVHRPLREGAEPPDGTLVFLIHLDRMADGQTCAPLTAVPGADGWF